MLQLQQGRRPPVQTVARFAEPLVCVGISADRLGHVLAAIQHKDFQDTVLLQYGPENNGVPIQLPINLNPGVRAVRDIAVSPDGQELSIKCDKPG
jgi:hypothetical protein